ncbi:hypothetical protein KRMM14A1004_62440 [Krasilnikovia sp. MM14-A1004]
MCGHPTLGSTPEADGPGISVLALTPAAVSIRVQKRRGPQSPTAPALGGQNAISPVASEPADAFDEA